MLVSLTIQDFAIVEYASFTPGKGLNILTGETGAGKSLIIDAISALLGHRIGRDYVRKDCDNIERAMVSMFLSLHMDCKKNITAIFSKASSWPMMYCRAAA